MVVKVMYGLYILDSGADSHVGGSSWLPLTALSGPLVKFANVIGFDHKSNKKLGLPIVTAVTKNVNNEGETIFLRAKHLIYNASSHHTLLSTYQMRELGIIVDDIPKRHLRDTSTYGTHSITFPKSRHVIPLSTKSAIPSFTVTKPTLSEYIEAEEEDILDIAF